MDSIEKLLYRAVSHHIGTDLYEDTRKKLFQFARELTSKHDPKTQHAYIAAYVDDRVVQAAVDVVMNYWRNQYGKVTEDELMEVLLLMEQPAMQKFLEISRKYSSFGNLVGSGIVTDPTLEHFARTAEEVVIEKYETIDHSFGSLKCSLYKEKSLYMTLQVSSKS